MSDRETNPALIVELDGERGEFAAFADPNLIDTLTTALNALWTGETRLPLEPSSSDSPTPTSENGATSMDDSSPVESVQAEPVRENLEIVGTSVEQSPTEPSVESGSFTPDLI